MNLINQVNAIPGDRKYLTIEQENMSFWAADLLAKYVDELIVCDPRRNALITNITKAENKNERSDTLNLCDLLRLGALRKIW